MEEFSYKIFYGDGDNVFDITDTCRDRLVYNQYILIPHDDHARYELFGDPAPGIEKRILVQNHTVRAYAPNFIVRVHVETGVTVVTDIREIESKLSKLHGILIHNHGTMHDEYPEQRMAMMYLKGDEKILEIGANTGRNSLIMSTLLDDPGNLVSVESDANIAEQLAENRDANQAGFHIVDAAISNRTLIQHGWRTIPSDVLLPGYNWVNTITLAELRAKYDIAFDTLVLDCEGAFYHILLDTPEILDGIKLIIVENDYAPKNNHKNYVDAELKKAGFVVDYSERGVPEARWSNYFSNFYEVWVRT